MNIRADRLSRSYHTIRRISEIIELQPDKLILGNTEAEDLINTQAVYFNEGVASFTDIPLTLCDESDFLAVVIKGVTIKSTLEGDECIFEIIPN